MTNELRETMRHIPDDELHAYLDQALSRSQCVEIESHLAGCVRCRMARDEIAALRDRTTALLGKLGPRRIQWVPLGTLQEEAEERRLRVRYWMRAGAWAATLFLALGLGWQARQWRRALVAPAVPTPIAINTAPAAPVAPAPATPAASIATADQPAVAAPRGREVPDAGAAARQAGAVTPEGPILPSEAPVGVELTAIEPSHAPGQVPSAGLWRTVTMEPASDSSAGPTRVDGLPVVQVQVQQAGTDQQITAVDQRLGSGEVIRLIDGPASQLADLMTTEMAPAQPAGPEAEPSQQPAHGDATITRRMGSRVLMLTGPPEMLSSLMTRVKVGTAAEKK
jgi:putative zinc finger protein